MLLSRKRSRIAQHQDQIYVLDDDSKQIEEGYPSDVSSGSEDSEESVSDDDAVWQLQEI